VACANPLRRAGGLRQSAQGKGRWLALGWSGCRAGARVKAGWTNETGGYTQMMHRRDFQQLSGAAIVSLAWGQSAAGKPAAFQPKYLLASCLYGTMFLGEILPEVRKTGAAAIDIWPKKHGNQREQIDDLGEQKFAAMLAEHQLQLGCITQYALGPFGLQSEMRLAQRLGCHTLVTGAAGPYNFTGSELKRAVADFVEK